jgi:hypothetical protein
MTLAQPSAWVKGMFASGFRFLAGVALAAVILQACPPPVRAQAAKTGLASTATHLQSEDYVRAASLVRLPGPAHGWWEEATAAERLARPAAGAVMLLTGYCDGSCGHAAIVTRIVGIREIRIDHADWLHDGAIYRNNPVTDVSAANDWSQVRVFNIRRNAWGEKIYAVRGFLTAAELPDPEPGSPFALTEEDRRIPSSLDE